jgi:hypothetical protein
MRPGADTAGAEDRFTALICIGCGAVDIPRECIGTCLDHPFGLVRTGDMREAEAALEATGTAAAVLEDLAVDLAGGSAPTEGTWDEALGAVRARAREGLHALAVATSSTAAGPGDDDVVTGWRCESCGRVEAPRPCIGVCTREPVEMVDATAYRAVWQALGQARERAESLAGLARRVAWTTPRSGQWERTYRAWQAGARALVARHPGSASRASSREAEPIGSRADAE